MEGNENNNCVALQPINDYATRIMTSMASGATAHRAAASTRQGILRQLPLRYERSSRQL